jgi:hypothetical protein
VGSGTYGLLNTTPSQHQLDLIYAQDIALAPYATVRLNEYYVSQYVDLSPLQHPSRGLRGSLRGRISRRRDAIPGA